MSTFRALAQGIIPPKNLGWFHYVMITKDKDDREVLVPIVALSESMAEVILKEQWSDLTLVGIQSKEVW